MEENKNEHPPKNEDEIANYYDGVKQLEKEGYETGIKKARTALFIAAGLLLLGEIISAGSSGVEITPLMVGIIVVEVGIFVALALWTKTKPYTAIITGLIIFIALWVLAIAIAGTKGAIGGIIIRIAIIASLISAMKPAKAWEEMKKNG